MLPVGLVTPRPERVVALITRLVLSPYSAGGAPEMISIDWIASDGSWFEKTLLNWSVMGWPSSDIEFWAWSPKPCINPLESAATPGETMVVIAVNEDEALSTGNRSIRFLSTSVWNVDSVSTRSFPSPSTVTVVLAPATFMVTFRLVATKERTSASCEKSENPAAFTFTWYGLKGTLANRNLPSASVVAVRSYLLTAF